VGSTALLLCKVNNLGTIFYNKLITFSQFWSTVQYVQYHTNFSLFSWQTYSSTYSTLYFRRISIVSYKIWEQQIFYSYLNISQKISKTCFLLKG
jgi:hypothetical protein